MVDVLRENDSLVCALRDATQNGAHGLAHVPSLVKKIVNGDRWRKRIVRTDETVTFDSFEEFVATPPLPGIGIEIDILKRLCKDDPDALEAIDRAVQRLPGRPPKKLDNVQGFPSGNTEQAALRRLRKHRPDLLAKVKDGTMSAHAAMLQAGFRQRSITIPTDPEAAASRLLRHFEGDRLRRIIELLMNQEEP